MLYILLLLNCISWVYYSKYQFIERDTRSIQANRKWHLWGWINKCSVFGLAYLLVGFKAALIAGLVYYVLFDVLINKIALSKPISYIGRTSRIDILAYQVFRNGWYYLAFKLLLIGLIALF